jgi:hypothetical protein
VTRLAVGVAALVVILAGLWLFDRSARDAGAAAVRVDQARSDTAEKERVRNEFDRESGGFSDARNRCILHALAAGRDGADCGDL